MGRDAIFSTGFERRFTFGIQSSGDIWLFGGVDTTDEHDLHNGQYSHKWSASRDIEIIQEMIEKIIYHENNEEILLPDFTQFEWSLEGTEAMRTWMSDNWKQIKFNNYRNMYTLELGCLIYHQILYDNELSVVYDP